MLVDTSVWVDHLAGGNPSLAGLLEAGEVETHPFVIGELTLGRLRWREKILGLLEALPSVPEAEHAEVMRLVEERGLAGSGLGWVDAHLLASALLGGSKVWTLDRPLASAAASLGIGPD